MNKITTISLFFLASGILTSVTILSGFQILFSISLTYYIYRAIKEKKIKLPPSAYWLMGFMLLSLLTIILNFDIIPNPSKNLGKLKYFLFGSGGIFVFTYWCQETSEKTKKMLIHTFLTSMIIAAIYAMGIYFFTDVKRAIPLTETMRYGYGSSLILLILISTYLHFDVFKNLVNKKFLFWAIIIGFFGMFFTYTRGALLSFLCGLPLVLFYYKKKLAVWGLIISGMILGCFLSYYLFSKSMNHNFRILSIRNNDSDIIRLSQWKSAILAIKERPLLGWGFSNFHTQVERIKITHDLEKKDYVDAHSHNIFLEITAGTGLVGLFLFLGWLISWAYESFKAKGVVAALIIPFGFAFIVAGQFEVIFDANNASMIFAIYSFSGVDFSKRVQPC